MCAWVGGQAAQVANKKVAKKKWPEVKNDAETQEREHGVEKADNCRRRQRRRRQRNRQCEERHLTLSCWRPAMSASRTAMRLLLRLSRVSAVARQTTAGTDESLPCRRAQSTGPRREWPAAAAAWPLLGHGFFPCSIESRLYFFPSLPRI